MDETRKRELDELLRASWATSERCTVTSLRAVGVELEGRVPKNWLQVSHELRLAFGRDRLEELDVTPPELVGRPYDERYTPGGEWQPRREKRQTYRRFVREHPTGVYVLGNTGHCTALVDGYLVDTEGHGPDTRRVQQAWRVTIGIGPEAPEDTDG